KSSGNPQNYLIKRPPYSSFENTERSSQRWLHFTNMWCLRRFPLGLRYTSDGGRMESVEQRMEVAAVEMGRGIHIEQEQYRPRIQAPPEPSREQTFLDGGKGDGVLDRGPPYPPQTRGAVRQGLPQIPRVPADRLPRNRCPYCHWYRP
ncbi:hypothetical protein MAR_007670, partial [Mya arenaria]